ncbi:MAG: iron ABC transporter permease [Candidatus Methanoplasma sp.]|jgi:ABC-type Fe3+-siderophore transport system permease subunit|nr:iron ABC transporter permease [Candidatus Methanoplasma sp.]
MGSDELRSEYRRYTLRKTLFIIVCIIGSVVAVGLSLSSGKYDIGFLESYQILFDHIAGIVPMTPTEVMEDYVVWDLRVPRSIAGLAVGAGLGVCGAAMQSSLKNPLADPYTTGISSGAALGATLMITLGISLIPHLGGELAIAINAFFFSLIPAGMIVFISVFKKTSPTSMILIGVAVTYVFSATTSLLMLYAVPEDLTEAYIWAVGTLGKATWDNVPYLCVAAVGGIVVMQIYAGRLNILALNDESAVSLGLNAKRLRITILIMISVVTSILVSFTGTIGFVGLVAPHMVRIFIGSDNRYLIPASAAFGAVLLLASDCISKSVGSTGLPVGVITALIGGPLFLLLIMRQRRSAWG